MNRRTFLASALAAGAARAALAETHPRAMLTPDLIREIAEKVKGPFAEEYRAMLATASIGPKFLDNMWSIPGAFMEAGLAFLVERELGRDGTRYARLIADFWNQPEWQKPGLARHFGWQGLLYDWVYDALTPDERARFGELLGEWVATWWKTAEVNIDRSGWWYNQHWGPAHLDEPNHRVALCAKLFISLAVSGNAGRFESAVQTNLRTFREKFLRDGLPALDEMGGIWSESNGHGNYGPLLTVPYGYEAVNSGLEIDPFETGAETGFGREYIRAGVWSMMPHNDKLAWIDDSSSGYPVQHARCAPMFARHYKDPVARWLSDTAIKKGWLYNSYLRQNEVWQRVAYMPPDLDPLSPGQAGWPLAYHFRGAGHVYMRSAWDDPDATWAFFGAGPSYAGHSRDDEGHFLITRKGQVVNRSGGQGHNDYCYYTGGSLVFNIVTIYHPDEKMRRDPYNENDGGLIRYVYSQNFPVPRARITAFWHDEKVATYAAADLTPGYWAAKAREVTRQLLYLRGPDECFVIFDRVESTSADLPKMWFLHLPSEPSIENGVCSWLSSPAGDTNLLTSGRTRAFLRTLAPGPARMVKRGGPDQNFWGHPYNPKAQYNHVLDKDGKEQAAYRQPPFSPWRLELEPEGRRDRDYFLNLLFLADEKVETAPAAERIEENGRLGARISLGSREVTALFDPSGPAGGSLRVAGIGGEIYSGDFPAGLD